MSLKYNTKQRYKSIQGLRSFKDTLPTEAKRIISKKGKVYNDTLDNWKYIVGKDLFKVFYPKSFKSSNKLRGNCLNIMVKRGSEVDIRQLMEYNPYLGRITEQPQQPPQEG